MRDPHDKTRPLRVGSLFSGYGGGSTSPSNTPWMPRRSGSPRTTNTSRASSPTTGPTPPNLGDITTIDWQSVPSIDVLCGHPPCQDVSTVGKRAGLAPGTRSGLWSHMAKAIDALHPQLVVIENVRGLLSSPAVRAPLEGDDNAQRNPGDATLRDLEPDPWGLGDSATRPLRAAGAVLDDLADLRYDAQWIGLPASLVGAPHPRLRIFILAHRQDAIQDTACHRLDPRRRITRTSASTARHDRVVTSDHPPGAQRAGWLAEQQQRTRDAVVADRGHLHRWGRYAHAIAQWEHVTGQIAPAPALLNESNGPRPSPEFVEWLMDFRPAG